MEFPFFLLGVRRWRKYKHRLEEHHEKLQKKRYEYNHEMQDGKPKQQETEHIT